MINIPWWSKIIAKIVLSRLPFGYAVWQKLGLFRHGKMDQSAYAIGVFNAHCERVGLKGDLKDRVILELGPGDSIATAIVAASYGTTAILVDSGKYVSEDINLYKTLAEDLQRVGLNPPDLSSAKTIEDILALCGAAYHTAGLASLKKIPQYSVDLYGNSLRIDRDGIPLYRHKPPHFLLPWLARFFTFSVSHHTVYFRREILDDIDFLDPRFDSHVDLVFIVKLFENYRSRYLNKDIAKFRITGCNASAVSYRSTAQVFGSLNSIPPQLYIVSKIFCALSNPSYLAYLIKRQAGLKGFDGST